MKIKSLYIEDFKNLKQFNLQFEAVKLRNVIVGVNAAGKSNTLEALVIIFRDLDLESQSEFGFEIEYECNKRNIKIKSETQKEDKQDLFSENQIIKVKEKYYYSFYCNNRKVNKSEFYKERNLNLPKYVFAYYSGISNRLEEHFDKHQKNFYNDLLKGKENPLRPLFYARPIHSNFVLMAFAAFPTEDTRKFLKDYLFIDGIDSVLFVLKQPPWNKTNKEIKGGDSKFWYAKGIVKDLLNKIYEHSIAPIRINNESTRIDFRRDENLDKIYLYIPSEEKIKEIADKIGTNVTFFKYLESTYISDLIQEVKIRVRKINEQGEITFKEMSEGEQQLLTVLGLLKFTKSEESLFLLDEPDTHLNPIWQQEYLKLLKEIAGEDTTSQILLTTHNPLILNSLLKEEVQVFQMDENRNVAANHPQIDPIGMGVDNILTSDIFGLMTTIDSELYKDQLKRRKLQVKKMKNNISQEELIEFDKLNEKLSALPYFEATDLNDPHYAHFLEISKIEEYSSIHLTEEKKNELKKQAKELFEKLKNAK